MPDDVKISEMSEAASLDNSAQFPYVQSMNGNLTTLKAPLSQIGTKINESMTFSNLQTTSKNIVGAINEAAQGGGVEYATELPISSTDPTDTKSYIDTKTTLVKSASGSLIHITDGGDNIPMKSCNITIEPIQTGSGTPSPSNPRAISGHTEANLVVCGKNIIPSNDLRATATHDSVTFTKTDVGRFNVSGTNGNATYGGYLSNNASILLKAGHTYRISGNWSGLTPSSSTVRVDLRYESTIFLHENTESFTPTVDTICYLGYRINANYSVPNGTVCSPCVTVDNSDTTYEQYNGTTYNIPFGQTVYGASGNAISGEYEVTYGVVDLGSLNYTTTTSRLFTTSGLSSVIKPTLSPFAVGNIKSSIYFPITSNAITGPLGANPSPDGAMAVNPAGTLYFNNVSITNVNDFKTAMDGVLLIYELATPTSLSLTPINPKTISGVNNIYNDCGDTAIEYFTSESDDVENLIEAHERYETDVQITLGSTMPSDMGLPYAVRSGNVVIVNFGVQIPLGTYYNTTVLWNIEPKPRATVYGAVRFGSNFTNLRINSDGTITFNTQQDGNNYWAVGQIVYIV